MFKMLLFIICEVPKKMSTVFKPFLAIFTLFHLKNWPYLQKPQFGNLAKTRFWLLLVNNSLCSIPPSWASSEIKEILGDRCAPPWPPWWWDWLINLHCHWSFNKPCLCLLATITTMLPVVTSLVASLVASLVTSLVTTAKLLLGKTTEIVNLLIFVFIVFSALKVKVGMSVFNYLLEFSNCNNDVYLHTQYTRMPFLCRKQVL